MMDTTVTGIDVIGAVEDRLVLVAEVHLTVLSDQTVVLATMGCANKTSVLAVLSTSEALTTVFTTVEAMFTLEDVAVLESCGFTAISVKVRGTLEAEVCEVAGKTVAATVTGTMAGLVAAMFVTGGKIGPKGTETGSVKGNF